MTTISATMVKELRERTGAGMMDCKTALTETAGDLENAIDWLRKKGILKAAKKADRIAAEGLIGMAGSGTSGAMVEVNSETDFVARNDVFQAMVTTIAGLALQAKGDIAALLAMIYEGTETVEVHVKEAVATIGENMHVRRTAALHVTHGAVASYTHAQVAPNLGKIGVLVALESDAKDTAGLNTLGRQLAMHIAATNPVALDLASVPAEILARENAILADKNQGKPEAVLEKIFASSLKSYAKDNCLLDQSYVHDASKSVAQVLHEADSRLGAPVAIKSFVRFALGEGIDKKAEDFAAEVAKVAGKS